MSIEVLENSDVKILLLNGMEITTEEMFHKKIAKLLDFESYYGENVHAFWDMMSCGLEKSIVIVWSNASFSRAEFKEGFDKIIYIFNELKNFYIEINAKRKFDFVLV